MASISRAGRLISPSTGVADRSRSSKFLDVLGGRVETLDKRTVIAIHRFDSPGFPPSPMPLSGSIITQPEPPRHGRFRIGTEEWQALDPGRRGLFVANELIASMVLAIWLYLLAGRGRILAGAASATKSPFRAQTARGRRLGRRSPPSFRRATRRNAWARPSLRCCARIIPARSTVIVVDDQSRDGTAQVARDAAAALGAAERLTVLSGRRAAAGLDRQAVGAAPGRRGGRERAAAAGLSAPDRCRHRLRPGCAQRARRARAGRRIRADVADGEAALRKPRRAHVRPRLHLLFPDALPVRLGERSAPRHRGGGRRLHAGAARALRRRAAWRRSAAR